VDEWGGNADYVGYLQNERTAWHNNLMGQIRAQQAMQTAKNFSAPVISGSGITGGGGGGGVGSIPNAAYTGKINFGKMAKGKATPVQGRVSQGWGKSRIKYAAGRHTGIDYGVKSGSRVGAAASGVVVRAGSEGAYGNAIHIKHPDGKTTLYAHLSGINVKAGQKVKVGQQIGKSGNTGRSFGAHLHFEVRGSDRYGGDINPASWH